MNPEILQCPICGSCPDFGHDGVKHFVRCVRACASVSVTASAGTLTKPDGMKLAIENWNAMAERNGDLWLGPQKK